MKLDTWKEHAKKKHSSYTPPAHERARATVENQFKYYPLKAWTITVLIVFLIGFLFVSCSLSKKVAFVGTHDEGVDGSEERAETVEGKEEVEKGKTREEKLLQEEKAKEMPSLKDIPPGTASSFNTSLYKEILFVNDSFMGSLVIGKKASSSLRDAVKQLSEKLTEPSKQGIDGLEIAVDNIRDEEFTSCKDLPELCSAEIHNKYGRYTYNQLLYLPDARVEYKIDKDDEEEIPRAYLYNHQKNVTYRYRILFYGALEGEVENVSGRSTTEVGGIKGTDLKLFNKKYTIARAYHPKTNHLKLHLVGGVKDVLEEGATKTYTVNAREYTIAAYVSGPQAVFVVNGIKLGPMKIGEVNVLHELEDGDRKALAVNEILENEAEEEGGNDLVEFYFGDQIVLEDKNTSRTSNFVGDTVKMNDQDMSEFLETDLIVTTDEGISAGSEVALKSIDIRYRPTDDLYVLGKMSEVVDNKEKKKGAFLNFFEFDYKGILNDGEMPDVENITLHPNGDREYKLAFTNKLGVQYDVPFAACTSEDCTLIRYGKYTENGFRKLIVNETNNVTENEYFFLRSDSWTHFFQLEEVDTDNRVVHIRDLAKDAEHQKRYEVSYDTNGTGQMTFEASTHLINVTDIRNKRVRIDFDGDGTMTDTSIKLRAELGGDFFLDGGKEPVFRFQSNELLEDTRRSEMNVTFAFAPKKKRLDINASDVLGNFIAGFNKSDSRSLVSNSTDTEWGMTEYGYTVELTHNDLLKQSEMIIHYPKSQLFGHMDIYSTVTREMLALDTAPPDKNKHHVLIGNACTNKVIAALQDNPKPCSKGWKEQGGEENRGSITLYKNAFGGEGSAIVVAGRDEEIIVQALQDWMGSME
jgi:hypothetical protein